MRYPRIIQGGMGVAVSNWNLARTVSRLGHLGVVSGTAIDHVFARRLQNGDIGGHLRRAMDHFPIPEFAQRVLDRYFIEGGKDPDRPFKQVPLFTMNPRRDLLELTVVANFVEVFLAKEGHDGPIGINLLQKVEMPTLPSLYGAMLAGVSFVLMGAGIPREIPGALDALARNEEATLKLQVVDATADDDYRLRFDPREFFGPNAPALERPRFLAIVSSTTLASNLLKKANGYIDGFVIEAPCAGGHNAPPRGRLQLTASGEPIYGPKDYVDFQRFRELDRPFWLAGGRSSFGALAEAEALGATGVQVGTRFAFCRESGMDPGVRAQILEGVVSGKVRVFTDPTASPTGFPFKVVEGIPDTVADETVYLARTRICDIGHLRTAYRRPNGSLGYRCPSEPTHRFEAKGGELQQTDGRKCLCNALLANIGLGQLRREGVEKPFVTSGDDLMRGISHLVDLYGTEYTAEDVIADLQETLLLSRVANA